MEQLCKSWVDYNSSGNKIWIAKFLCPKCSKEVIKRLQGGKAAKTCGCGQYDNHQTHGHTVGMARPKLYGVWRGMKDRCLNSNHKRYKHYGGRGIIVCEEWINDFGKFNDWAKSNGYKEGLQIDRENNDGNYEPSNCRFVTLAENNRNKQNTKLSLDIADEVRRLYATGECSYTFIGKKFNLPQWSVWAILKNKVWVR